MVLALVWTILCLVPSPSAPNRLSWLRLARVAAEEASMAALSLPLTTSHFCSLRVQHSLQCWIKRRSWAKTQPIDLSKCKEPKFDSTLNSVNLIICHLKILEETYWYFWGYSHIEKTSGPSSPPDHRSSHIFAPHPFSFLSQWEKTIIIIKILSDIYKPGAADVIDPASA